MGWHRLRSCDLRLLLLAPFHVSLCACCCIPHCDVVWRGWLAGFCVALPLAGAATCSFVCERARCVGLIEVWGHLAPAHKHEAKSQGIVAEGCQAGQCAT